MTETIGRLAWGLTNAVPGTATSAWGARSIIDQLGHVDLSVPGRTDRAGSTAIFDRLEAEFPASALIAKLRGMLLSGEMDTRRGQLFTLYESPTLTVAADTKGSAGYCYIAAWTEA
jgi:hypothetical protein